VTAFLLITASISEHLKEIAFYYPGVWFKANLIYGGVTFRLFKKDHGRV